LTPGAHRVEYVVSMLAWVAIGGLSMAKLTIAEVAMAKHQEEY